jgi:tRNA (guanine-N7-)-methyltransferase
MPRRNLDRKKTPALDERTAARYLLELPGDRLYREPLAFPRVSSASLFRNERPMELEIGCGNGEFLCSLARRDRETNFVGVEVKRKSALEAVARASSAELANVIFLRANFRLLYPLLARARSAPSTYTSLTPTRAPGFGSVGSSPTVSCARCTQPRHPMEGSAS